MFTQHRKSGGSTLFISPLAFRFGFCVFVWLVAAPTFADIVPGYYEESGILPYREYLNQNENEYIDPFTGKLQLHYVDIVLPGNGGMDIKVQRSYTSRGYYNFQRYGFPGNNGIGWHMHFGRVLVLTANVCVGDTNGTIQDNPVLELPDGSRRILYFHRSVNPSGPLYLTNDRWKADCAPGNNGLIVTSPEGVVYTMTQPSRTCAWSICENSYYATLITDKNGNSINISYRPGYANRMLISQVWASDGRQLDYYYFDEGTNDVRLSAITVRNGPTWQYSYYQVPLHTIDYDGNFWQLGRVTRPDGSYWLYSYYPETMQSQTLPSASNFSLMSVRNPFGGLVSYSYSYDETNPYEPLNIVVTLKDVMSDTGVILDRWGFSYARSTVASASYDVTTVATPSGVIVYRHVGIPAASSGSVWRIGQLVEKVTSGSQTERYTWGSQIISSENQSRSTAFYSSIFDDNINAPILTMRSVVRDGTTYTTTYSNHDNFGNAQTVIETGNSTRRTDVVYLNNTTKWLVHTIKDESIANGGSIRRAFDLNGNLLSINRYGVETAFSYYVTGDLATRRDARGNSTSYSNYKRGIAQTEQRPQGVTITRAVNDSGTVQWARNGRLNTTSYTYDGLNRVTGIAYPVNLGVSVSWSPTTKTTTRGVYRETINFDGFGRPTRIERRDTARGLSTYISYVYDALGRKTFASYPNASTGTAYSYDALGRMTRVTHADGTSRTLQYLAGNVTRITNERGYATSLTYRSYGDPDHTGDKVLMRVDAPNGISTVFVRNVLGLPTNVTQGGVVRTYGYNVNNYLISEVHPETGTTSYGRDAVGNMISRQVGSSGVSTYTYDGLNRLTLVDYPGTTPDVSYQYDANNNLTVVDNGVARRTSSYDANDNLRTETLVTNGLTFNAAYGFNTLDQLTSIVYPSLRQVSYAPDALGRPTTVTPYLTSVTHHPNGVPATLTHVNGHVTTAALTNRQWLGRSYTQRAGTGAATDLSYVYDGLANVTSITNTLDATDSKSMTYDGVDRLRTAGTSSVLYDPADNITSYITPVGTLTYSYIGNRLDSISGYRSASFNYDAYGNVTGNGTRNFNYDDAGNLRSVDGGNSANYDYDGKNRRVHTSVSGVDRYFFQTADGRLLGEYDNAGIWVKEYAYLGTRLVTTVENVPDVAPGPPASITVPATSTGTHTIAWGTATGTVTRYELEQDTSNSFMAPISVYSGTASSSNATVTQNGTYYYRVRACMGTACGAFVTGTNGVVVTLPVPPSAPSSITVPATSTSTGTHTITWGSATGTVPQYELYQDTNATFTAPTLVYSGTALSSNATVTKSGTYYYRVRACNTSLCSGYTVGANGVLAQTPGIPPALYVPATVQASTSYEVRWEVSSGAVTHYELQEGVTISAFALPTTWTLLYSGPNLSATIPGKILLGSKKYYYYRVRACNSLGCSAFRTSTKLTLSLLLFPNWSFALSEDYAQRAFAVLPPTSTWRAFSKGTCYG